MLLFLLSRPPYFKAVRKLKSESARPDIEAAIRGGDWSLRMDGEGLPAEASLQQALYWRQIYIEILAMEEDVLDRIQKLMAMQSDTARHEVELTNLPDVVDQAEQ